MNRTYPEKPFLSCFGKLYPTDEQIALLSLVKEYSYTIDKENRRMEIFLASDAPLNPETVLSLQNDIAELYSLNFCRVRPEYPDRSFSLDDLSDVFRYLEDEAIGTQSLFKNCAADLCDGTTLKISLAPGMLRLAQNADCGAKIKEIVRAQFKTELTVTLSGEDLNLQDYNRSVDKAQIVFEKRRTDYTNSNSGVYPEKSELSFNEDQNLIVCGYHTFDLNDGEPLYGKKIAQPILSRLMPISALKANDEVQLFCGKLFASDYRESKKGTRGILTLYLTDDAASVTVKVLSSVQTARELAEIPVGTPLMIEGKISPDTYDDNEPTCMANAIVRIREILKTDDAPEKRVELHLHSSLSAMDALAKPEEIIELAARFGHKAVAFTDHGNAQAFPMAMNAVKKLQKKGRLPEDFKVLYGMEGYFVDDTARAFHGDADADFLTDAFVVFDLETTGLSAASCAITEIGAVRFRAGKVEDTFSTYVDPGMPIPAEITRLTGITDEMVRGAPSQKDAVKAFLDFAADAVLVAHNASFDTGFVRTVCVRENLSFENSYLDTVALSRYLNPELNKHKLDTLAEFYRLGDFNHHRAVDDTVMLAQIFNKMIERMKCDGIRTISALTAAMAEGSDPKRLPTRHITLLAKNQTGLKNLYKLISFSYLDYFRRFPRLPKTVLQQYREGLLIGSACEAGELYTAIVTGKSDAELYRIADFYDYFEIQPLANNAFLIEKGLVDSMDRLREYNKKVLAIAKKQQKPCCATGDVHFLYPQDQIYRQVLQYAQGYGDALRDMPLYFRTTREMLDEFSYLSPEDAREVVIDAPNRIADSIDRLSPIPAGKYPPIIEGADEELRQKCYESAHKLFGDKLPKIVEDRLERELTPIIKHGYAILYVIAKRLVENSESFGYHVGSRGSVGSSLVATLSGISEVNPLPPYYLCPNCHYSDFVPDDGTYGSGFDMPPKDCPHCGTRMLQDGHNIPFETFLGFDGDKEPDIDLNFSGFAQSKAHKYTEELFGHDKAFRAGTISGVKEKTAFGYAKKFAEGEGLFLSKAALQRIVSGCTDIKRTTGQHPGGIIVIPRDKEIYDFTPVQHPADKENAGVITTHFPYEYLHETIYKLDILGHDVPTKYKMIEDFTHTSVLDVPMNDPEVLGLLLSPKPLGVTAEDLGFATGTLALPELGTPFVCGLLQKTKPLCFSDLLQISGLSHGTGVWLGNAEELIAEGTCKIGEVIGTRDSIMVYLMQKGLDKKLSFDIMERVRKKDKTLLPEQEEVMREHKIPEWYIESCKKITYMFPKAHAAAYIISALRLGWYKVHMPLEFYCSYFSAAPDGFDADFAFLPLPELKRRIAELSELGVRASQKEEDTLTAMQILLEMRLRKIELLPATLTQSDAFLFLPENGKMRLPLIAINGVGDTAAQSIADAMKSGKIFSQDDLQTYAKVNSSVLEKLRIGGSMGDLPETAQISLF